MSDQVGVGQGNDGLECTTNSPAVIASRSWSSMVKRASAWA